MGSEEPAGIGDIFDLVARLRGEGGCPWDRKQTPESMTKYLLAECKELIEAVESGDPAAVREESGDLLFILVFLVSLYEERGDFDRGDVCAEVHAKMLRRHPHVFGDAKPHGEEELIRQWEAIKAEERRAKRGGEE